MFYIQSIPMFIAGIALLFVGGIGVGYLFKK